MSKHGRITICVVCGTLLPEYTFQEYRDKGMSSMVADGAELHHCPNHTRDEIIRMAQAVPNFHRAGDYKKYAED
jgi:hypothetical protein